MSVNKSWIYFRARNYLEYEAGVKNFIEKMRLHVNEE